MSRRYLPWKCPACGWSNLKGTTIAPNDLECRGKCSRCPRSVRNVYAHIERTWDAGGFASRLDCKKHCDDVNRDREVEVIALD